MSGNQMADGDYKHDALSAIHPAVKNAKVLVVGAGGIGCELFKNLVMSGFENIEVMDLDTIDVSNLNRQFLFRRNHVGQPKALVAKESVLRYNPNAKIEALHTRIENPRYSVAYMRTFHIVLSALDNQAARRYLNRLCFAARVPLIESGTQGYNGQCTPIIHGQTKCYECEPLPAPKTFAVCTIRNTPERPEHCVAWAKLLLTRLFGPDNDENTLNDMHLTRYHPTSTKTDTSTNSDSAMTNSSPLSLSDPYDYALSVFEACFTTEIAYQRSIESRWVERPPPSILYVKDLLSSATNMLGSDHALTKAIERHIERTSNTPSPSTTSQEGDSASVLGVVSPSIRTINAYTQRQSVQVGAYYAIRFLLSIAHVCIQRTDDIGAMEFDKDDDDGMAVVATASNLRMLCYGIKCKSEFDLKGIAGNIVHAIATTNAIVSGLIVIEAVKTLKLLYSHKHNQPTTTSSSSSSPSSSSSDGDTTTLVNGWITQREPRPVYGERPEHTYPSCFCSQLLIDASVDMKRCTLKTIYRRVCGRVGMKSASLDVITKGGHYLDYEDGYDGASDSDDDVNEADRIKVEAMNKAITTTTTNTSSPSSSSTSSSSPIAPPRPVSLIRRPLNTIDFITGGALLVAKDDSGLVATIRLTDMDEEGDGKSGDRVKVIYDEADLKRRLDAVEKEKLKQQQAEEKMRLEEEKKRQKLMEAMEISDGDDGGSGAGQGLKAGALKNGAGTLKTTSSKPSANNNIDDDDDLIEVLDDDITITPAKPTQTATTTTSNDHGDANQGGSSKRHRGNDDVDVSKKTNGSMEEDIIEL